MPTIERSFALREAGMAFADISFDVMLAHLDHLAQSALALWDLPPDAVARRINVSENVTYLVEAADGFRAVLRVHRENYHSRRAIESELAWMGALEQEGIVATPKHFLGRDGKAIQEFGHIGLAGPRFLVLFHFVPGRQPDQRDDLTGAFHQLGAIAARMHLHARQWQRPDGFERLLWDETAVFGPTPIWGDWRNGPHVDHAIRAVLEPVETTLQRRLSAFGKGPARFGLIHADMRLANLLISDAAPRVIDFDDCGFGWFLSDFAAAISFIETDPSIPALKAAWLDGYRTIHPLSAADEAEIDSFIMLRRLALLAWIGSHADAPEPQALAPHFAQGSAELAERWLSAQ